YKQRHEVLFSDNIRDIVFGMIDSVIERIVAAHCPKEEVPEDWDLAAIVEYGNGTFLKEGQVSPEQLEGKEPEEIIEYLKDVVRKTYEEREANLPPEFMREFEKVIVLRAVDSKWMDHIDAMDQLRQGIHLRAYGGTDPLREYQFEGFAMFEEMIASIQEEVAKYAMKAQVEANQKRQEVAKGQAVPTGKEEAVKRPAKAESQIGRNDLCPCGSGKKYKQCHGAQG
ncbi:MAG TPA: SEC-C metal-binding domain-containing protein, partial [Paenibacillus sp.]|nr:SEC-C metal-binding domain-containing protein [Paenibacillus sp.]